MAEKRGPPAAAAPARDWLGWYFGEPGKRVYQRAQMLTGCPHAAKELVQEVGLALLKANKAAMGDPDSYVMGIYRNMERKWIRSKAAARKEGGWEPDQIGQLPDTRAARNPAEDGELVEQVHQVLAKMTDVERAALLLRYVDGLSLEEIAQVLDRTPKAVKSLLARARVSFREKAPPSLPEHFGVPTGEEEA